MFGQAPFGDYFPPIPCYPLAEAFARQGPAAAWDNRAPEITNVWRRNRRAFRPSDNGLNLGL
jgi:hypothetical protein